MKSTEGKVELLTEEEDSESWTLCDRTQHAVEGSLDKLIQNAIIDLKHRAVMAEKIRPLLDAKIQELEGYLLKGRSPLKEEGESENFSLKVRSRRVSEYYRYST